MRKQKLFTWFLAVLVTLALTIATFSTFTTFSTYSLSNEKSEFTLSEEEKLFIASHPIIYYAPDINYAPYEQWSNNEAVGLIPDYLKIIEDKTGLTVKAVYYESFMVALKAVMDKEADIAFASPSDERKETLLFTSKIVEVPEAIIVRNNERDIMTIEDLKDKSIGLIEGFLGTTMLMKQYPDYDFLQYPNSDRVLAAVSFGEVDASIVNIGVASYGIEKQKLTNLKAVGLVKTEPVVAFAIRNDYPELQSIINKVLGSLSDESRNQIENRWIHLTFVPPINRTWVYQLALVLLVLALVVAVWVFTLKREVKRRSSAIVATKYVLETIIDHIPHIIYVRDSQGNYVMVNSVTAQYHGLPKEELLGVNIKDLNKHLSFTENEALVNRDKYVIETNKTIEVPEEVVMDPQGRKHIYYIIKRPIVLFEIQQTCSLTVAMDITTSIERKQAIASTEESLRIAEMKLADLDKKATLGSLVAGITHEINNPIGISVTALSHLKAEFGEFYDLFEQGVLTQSALKSFVETSNETIDILENNINRAVEMITSFKRMSVDQLSETRATFDLKETIEHVIHSLHFQFKLKKIDISFICNDSIIIDSFPGSYSQVFTNLLMNSVVHGFENMDSGKIEISIVSGADFIEIHYRDNGVGINSDQLEKVWQPYFTTKREKGGSGLGMQIIYNIVVRTLGGKIEFTSQPNQGVYCFIKLPRKLKE